MTFKEVLAKEIDREESREQPNIKHSSMSAVEHLNRLSAMVPLRPEQKKRF